MVVVLRHLSLWLLGLRLIKDSMLLAVCPVLYAEAIWAVLLVVVEAVRPLEEAAVLRFWIERRLLLIEREIIPCLIVEVVLTRLVTYWQQVALDSVRSWRPVWYYCWLRLGLRFGFGSWARLLLRMSWIWSLLDELGLILFGHGDGRVFSIKLLDRVWILWNILMLNHWFYNSLAFKKLANLFTLIFVFLKLRCWKILIRIEHYLLTLLHIFLLILIIITWCWSSLLKCVTLYLSASETIMIFIAL